MLLRARYLCHCDSESDLWMNEFQRTCIRAHSHKQSQICSWYAESHFVELILSLSLSYSSDTQTHPYQICIQKSHSTQRLRIYTKKYTKLSLSTAHTAQHILPHYSTFPATLVCCCYRCRRRRCHRCRTHSHKHFEIHVYEFIRKSSHHHSLRSSRKNRQ